MEIPVNLPASLHARVPASSQEVCCLLPDKTRPHLDFSKFRHEIVLVGEPCSSHFRGSSRSYFQPSRWFTDLCSHQRRHCCLAGVSSCPHTNCEDASPTRSPLLLENPPSFDSLRIALASATPQHDLACFCSHVLLSLHGPIAKVHYWGFSLEAGK